MPGPEEFRAMSSDEIGRAGRIDEAPHSHLAVSRWLLLLNEGCNYIASTFPADSPVLHWKKKSTTTEQRPSVDGDDSENTGLVSSGRTRVKQQLLPGPDPCADVFTYPKNSRNTLQQLHSPLKVGVSSVSLRDTSTNVALLTASDRPMTRTRLVFESQTMDFSIGEGKSSFVLTVGWRCFRYEQDGHSAGHIIAALLIPGGQEVKPGTGHGPSLFTGKSDLMASPTTRVEVDPTKARLSYGTDAALR
ncbi:hypothetical protein FA13DRAFT_1771890 [Coprinellus micaceus]|uniref:Uncharacterized protein n=1 Tax=Coprinellus micaceus TaxID=71717 RepID=A0A4Y7TND7_COPMI|nr:hypothetical protein FA13DRAFT_1771890 [Coprinellus micaceus]